MAEVFNFDFFQIPHTGVEQPEAEAQLSARSTGDQIRRPLNMKISRFGSNFVGSRMSTDYTRTTLDFKFKGESEAWDVITADTGIGQNVGSRSNFTVHNPYILGSTVLRVRDDQFIRMGLSRNTGTTTEAYQVELPKFDVMDTKVATQEGINATSNSTIKNWPTEGFRSYGGKYDFLPYDGGILK